MNQNERRLTELYRDLSADERGRLALLAWKEDRKEERELRETMPGSQAPRFNELVDVLRACQGEVSWYAFWLQARAETVNARISGLLAMQLWALGMSQVGSYLGFHTQEPITESEYEKRLAEAAAEMLPLEAVAEMMTEDDEDAASLSERQYAARQRQHAQALKAAVKRGELRSRRQGGLSVEAGSFYAWRGEELRPYPEWGSGYAVRPDKRAQEVEWERKSWQAARKAIRCAPFWLVEGGEPADGRMNEMAKVTLARAVVELQEIWSELLVLDEVAEKAGGSFAGEEPLHPDLRTVIERTRRACKEAGETLSGLGAVIEWPEGPNPEMVELLTTLVEGRLV